MVKNPTTKAARAVRQLRAGAEAGAHRHARSRTGCPSCGRSSTPSTRGCSAASSGSASASAPRSSATATRPPPNALRRLTQPFVLRRTKADRRLLPDLPDKIEQIAFAQLTREQAVLYQQVVDQLLHDAAHEEGMRRRGRVLAALTRLKQVCNHPAHALRDGSRLAGRSGKLNRFDELVAELLDVERTGAGVHPVPRDGRAVATARPRPLPHRRPVPARWCRPRPGATGWSPSSRPANGAAAAARVAARRRDRAQPDRRQPGDPLRPMVEPGRRGPSDRPGVADRPAPHRQRAQARVRGHGRGADRPGDRRQAYARRRRGRQRRGVAHRARHRRPPRPRRLDRTAR